MVSHMGFAFIKMQSGICLFLDEILAKSFLVHARAIVVLSTGYISRLGPS
jgi:hypothetical protein